MGLPHHGITELLIAHGANLKAATEKKETFLHHAAYLGNIELARPIWTRVELSILQTKKVKPLSIVQSDRGIGKWSLC